ncbi:MAG TPA: sulfatase [Sphingobacteriaceae bacterium]|nr:sulfatase [Sphingobacteriaceae bacterium]
MQRLTSTLLPVLLLIMLLCSSHTHVVTDAGTSAKKRYNVLFILVDDLRPDLGCYGNTIIRTPHIDGLALQGTVFKNQFVTVPTCGASRMSLLTGMRPRTMAGLSNEVFESGLLNKLKGKPESFVEHFRRNGYYTLGIGKVSHSPDGYIYKYLEPKGKSRELPNSWNEMLFNPGKWGTGWNAFFGYADGTNRNSLKGDVKPYEHANVPDDSYPDGLTANLAVQKLNELSGKNQPFFLGIGFFKPHLPFNAPKKYWDLYNEDDITLTPSSNIPLNMNKAGLHESGEFNGYKRGDEKASLDKPVSDDYARKLRRSYYSAISYTDAQVGKVLAELKRLDLDKNTIIVLWGDHGWHLGDDRVWGKHTITEWAVRSPLIVKVPGMLTGKSSDKIISSIDIYPSLMDLCGLKTHKTDGKSFMPLLKKDPNSVKWSNAAYSYYRNGISVRTDRYRLSKYFRKEQPVTELYDHLTDPYEKVNIAAENAVVVKRLNRIWEKGNTGLFNKAGE